MTRMTPDDNRDDALDDEPRSRADVCLDVICCVIDISWLVVVVGTIVALTAWAMRL